MAVSGELHLLMRPSARWCSRLLQFEAQKNAPKESGALPGVQDR
jgi:hypothetical protein